MTRMRKFFAVLVGALLLAANARADNETFLRVRARTRLDLRSVRRVHVGNDDGVRVEGVLVDEPLGRPVVGRTVAIDVEGRSDDDRGFYRYAEPTGADGGFRFTAPLPLGRYTLRLLAGGDAQYGPAAPVVRNLDLARSTPSLAMHLPVLAAVEAGEVAVDITATEEPPLDAPLGMSAGSTAPVELPLALLVDEEQVAAGRSSGGHWRPTLDPRRLGSPGHSARVTVRFAGDARRNGAEESGTIVVATQTRLDVRSTAAAIEGVLHDGLGPVGGAIISVVTDSDGGAALAHATSKPDGTFVAVVASLGRGPHPLRVEAAPLERWRLASSLRLTVTIAGAAAVGRLPYFVPALLTLMSLGAAGWWLRIQARRAAAPSATTKPAHATRGRAR